MWCSVHGQKLLVSTSYDRKVKLWDAVTGHSIDSLRKGCSDEAYPIEYLEKQVSAQTKYTLNQALSSG